MKRAVSIGLLVVGICAFSFCKADTVIVENGDRLTGKIKAMESGKLTIKTEYSEIKLPWEQVKSLVTDAPIFVKLDGGTLLIGRAVNARSAGNLRIINGELGAMSLPLASVREIRLHPKPPVDVHGHLNVAARTTQGNSKTGSYHGDGEVTARTIKSRYLLGFAANFGKDENGISQQNSLGYVRYDYFLTDQWFLNSNFSVLHDRFRDLNLRTTIGLGAGYQFFETESLKLSVESGINYINEDFRNAGDDGRAAGRWALNYEQGFFDGGLTVFHYDEILVGIDALTKDILATLRNGLRFPLFMSFVGTVQVNINFDNNPAPGFKKADFAYLLGVGYEF